MEYKKEEFIPDFLVPMFERWRRIHNACGGGGEAWEANRRLR